MKRVRLVNLPLTAVPDRCERLAAISVKARSRSAKATACLRVSFSALTRGLALSEAVRFGMAGAAALSGSGTKLCRRSDVERLYSRQFLG